MKKIHFLLSIFFIIGLCSCEEKYDLDTPKGMDRLVVDGWLTNSSDTSFVYLSKNQAYTDNSAPTPETGALLVIYDNFGPVDTLTEVQPGKYQIGNFERIIDRIYHIKITLIDGVKYESKPEKMTEVMKIDSIYFRERTDLLGNVNYRVLLDTEQEPPVRGDHYRYMVWINDTLQNTPFDIIIYNDDFVNGIAIPEVEFDYRLEIGDRVKVQQMYISRDAYKFLNLIQQQAGFVGTPFDPPPAPIIGNVFRTDQPTFVALGYFGVSSVDQASITIE